MSSSSQEYIGKPSSFPFRNLEWAPKCPCGYRYMILKTSRITSNPGRKFWKCPDLHGERGCGLLIWMDELALECMPMSTLSRGQIEVKMEEMKYSIKELKDSIKNLCVDIRRLSERMETHITGSQRNRGLPYLIVILLLFIMYMWRGQKDGRAYLSYEM